MLKNAKMKIKKQLLITFPLLIMISIIGYLTLNVRADVTITTDSSKQGTKDINSYLVTNTGTFTIAKSSDDRSKFAAYKVLDVYYNRTNNNLVYQFTDTFKNFQTSTTNTTYKNLTESDYMELNIGDAISTPGSFVSGGNTTSNDFAKLMSAYASYIKSNHITGITINASSGTSTSATMAVGTYLVLPTVSNLTYDVMVDNIELVASGNTWTIEDARVNAKASEPTITKTYSYGGQTGSKISAPITANSYPITVTTIITLPTWSSDTISTKSITVNLGTDSVNYGELYQVNGMNLSSSQEMGNASVFDAQGKEIGRVTNNGDHQITFSFDPTAITTNIIEITYKTELRSLNTSYPATLGSAGNSSTTTYSYSDPYSTEMITKTATASLVTYALQVTGNAGAVFDVYNSSDNVKVGSVTIGSDGLGELIGIAEGTYYVKQTTAPAGYSLLTNTPSTKVGTGGTEVSGKIGYYNVSAMNNTPALLPFTGSIGTMLFVIIGSIFAIAAIAFAIIYYKKKQNFSKENETEIK